MQQILDYLHIYLVDVLSVYIFVLVGTWRSNTDVRSVIAAYDVGKASDSHEFDFLSVRLLMCWHEHPAMHQSLDVSPLKLYTCLPRSFRMLNSGSSQLRRIGGQSVLAEAPIMSLGE